MNQRIDSLDKYYKKINSFSKFSNVFFILNVFISIVSVGIDNKMQYKEVLDYIFIATILIYFVTDNYLTIFMMPEVEEKRRKNLLSNSFNVPLDNERTINYYNNDVEPSIVKLGVNIFENSLFGMRVTHEMVVSVRWKIGAFILLFLILLVMRETKLEFISIVTQVLFASALLPSYIRLEKLYYKNRSTFAELYNLFLHNNKNEMVGNPKMIASLLDCFVKYEASKAYSGVRQDSKIFKKLNTEVSAEWEEIKIQLEI